MAPEDSFPNVFATARMVAFMEIAATRLMRPLLEPGQHSVGVSVSITHTAPTPIGGTVRTVATYLGPDGKLFRFKVEAFDDAGPIGDGEHCARHRFDEPVAGRRREAAPRHSSLIGA